MDRSDVPRTGFHAYRLVLDQHQYRHVSIVTRPAAELDHAGVTTLPVSITGRNLIEQLADDIHIFERAVLGFDRPYVRQPGSGKPASMYRCRGVGSVSQTALGKEIKGEGLVGLTRGFMYAGAERVVDFYRENGPTALGQELLLDSFDQFRIAGYAALLIGMKVPFERTYVPTESDWKIWNTRRQKFKEAALRALTVREALDIIASPRWRWA